MRYWVYASGEIKGPYSVKELLLLPGFGAASLVCQEDSEGRADKDWVCAGDVARLSAEFTEQQKLETPPEPAAEADAAEKPQKDEISSLLRGMNFSEKEVRLLETESPDEDDKRLDEIEQQLEGLRQQLGGLPSDGSAIAGGVEEDRPSDRKLHSFDDGKPRQPRCLGEAAPDWNKRFDVNENLQAVASDPSYFSDEDELTENAPAAAQAQPAQQIYAAPQPQYVSQAPAQYAPQPSAEPYAQQAPGAQFVSQPAAQPYAAQASAQYAPQSGAEGQLPLAQPAASIDISQPSPFEVEEPSASEVPAAEAQPAAYGEAAASAASSQQAAPVVPAVMPEQFGSIDIASPFEEAPQPAATVDFSDLKNKTTETYAEGQSQQAAAAPQQEASPSETVHFGSLDLASAAAPAADASAAEAEPEFSGVEKPPESGDAASENAPVMESAAESAESASPAQNAAAPSFGSMEFAVPEASSQQSAGLNISPEMPALRIAGTETPSAAAASPETAAPVMPSQDGAVSADTLSFSKRNFDMPQGAAILPAGAGGDNAAPALNVRQESAPAASQDLNLQRFASGGTTGEADYFATIVNEGGGESSPELNRTGAAARETVAVAQAIRSSSPTLTAFGAKKSGSKMKPVLIVLVLLAVGGAALMFLGGGGKKKIPAAEKTAPAETAAPAASAPAQTPAPSASSMPMPQTPASAFASTDALPSAGLPASTESASGLPQMPSSSLPPSGQLPSAQSAFPAAPDNGQKLEQQAIDIVKNHDLGGGRGTILQWFRNAFITAGATAEQEEWTATVLSGSTYVVKYRLRVPQADPIVYQFEVDVTAGKIVRGVDNAAVELLSAAPAPSASSATKAPVYKEVKPTYAKKPKTAAKKTSAVKKTKTVKPASSALPQLALPEDPNPRRVNKRLLDPEALDE